MKLSIELTRPFSDAVGKRSIEIEFQGSTVEELFQFLSGRYPGLKKELYSETGEITDYVNVFVNDKPIYALDEMKTGLRNGDRLLFFFPVSGG